MSSTPASDAAGCVSSGKAAHGGRLYSYHVCAPEPQSVLPTYVQAAHNTGTEDGKPQLAKVAVAGPSPSHGYDSEIGGDHPSSSFMTMQSVPSTEFGVLEVSLDSVYAMTHQQQQRTAVAASAGRYDVPSTVTLVPSAPPSVAAARSYMSGSDVATLIESAAATAATEKASSTRSTDCSDTSIGSHGSAPSPQQLEFRRLALDRGDWNEVSLSPSLSPSLSLPLYLSLSRSFFFLSFFLYEVTKGV